MNEAGFWSGFVKKALHAPEHGRIAWKLQDATNRGLPDVVAVNRSQVALIELKYVKEYPKREDTRIPVNVSVEQRRRLEQWHRAHGQAYVLVGVEKDWYLLPWDADHATRDELLEHPRGPRSKNGHEALIQAVFYPNTKRFSGYIPVLVVEGDSQPTLVERVERLKERLSE